MERWKNIDGYPGYLISDYGRVKSIKKVVIQSNGHSMTFPERILKPGVSHGGYLYVTLCRNGDHKAFKIHRLVVNAFIGHFSPPRNIIHHKDHDRRNNKVENLMWVTQKENINFNIEKYGKAFNRDWHGRFSKAT